MAMGMTEGHNAVAVTQGAFVSWTYRYDATMVFPLAVINHRDHGSIANPSVRGEGEIAAEQAQFQKFLLSALRCQSFAAYQASRRTGMSTLKKFRILRMLMKTTTCTYSSMSLLWMSTRSQCPTT